MSDQLERTFSLCEHKWTASNCKKCAIYFHESNPAQKTNLYDSFLNCSAKKYLKHMRKRQCNSMSIQDIEEQTWKLLVSICDKFKYSLETLALGLYIFANTYKRNEKDERFWASSALLVASKSIELDKNVPYLTRYQRYSEKEYTQEDYETAERTIFSEMKFDVQYTTFVSFLHFYLTNGFLFQSDSLSAQKIKLIEDEVLTRAKEFMKNGSFVSYNPEKLALSIIKETREHHRLNPWPAEIEHLSEFKSSQIKIIERNIQVLKPLSHLSIRTREKLSSMCQNNPVNSLQSSIQLAEKPRIVRRKNESLMKLSKKENSFKPQPFSHQSFLANMRNQPSALAKSSLDSISLNSTLHRSEKLIPIFGAQHRLI